MGGETITEAVGSPSDVQNINPYTQGFYGQLQGLQNQFLGGMGQYDPSKFGAYLKSQSPYIQDLMSQIVSPYAKSAQETTKLLQEQGLRDVMSQFSNYGAAVSGPAMKQAAMEGGYLPLAQMTQNIAQMQSQLGGALLGQAGTGFQQAYGTQAGLYGQALGQQAGLAAPEYWQPTYMQHTEPGLLDWLGGIGSFGLGAGMLMTGNPLGLLGIFGGAEQLGNQLPSGGQAAGGMGGPMAPPSFQ